MTTDLREIFVTGLRNAHAMENQALAIMKPQISRIENYPEVKARLELHYRETEGQVARIEEVLHGLSEKSSTIKDAALSMTGSLASLGHSIAGDEIIKNSLANFAFENYEIAAYKSLLTVADHGGYQSAHSAIAMNLEEEVNMARWLEDHLEKVTLEFLALSEQGQTAKV